MVIVGRNQNNNPVIFTVILLFYLTTYLSVQRDNVVDWQERR